MACQTQARTTRVETPCLTCGALTMNPRFCSRGCAVSRANRISPKRPRVPHSCRYCGVTIPKGDTTLCSRKCKTEWFVREWLAGMTEGHGKCGDLRSAVRAWILRRDGWKCSRCGWAECNPILGRPLLEIDHVDGNVWNSRPENLSTLCPNCHSLTPTYRVLNRGNGGRRSGPPRS